MNKEDAPYPCCNCSLFESTEDENMNPCIMGRYISSQHCPDFDEDEEKDE